jgi:alcohol dehydrogenase, propanol-preferring
MKAMLFESAGAPLAWTDVPDPQPGAHQLLLRVRACGVCRTDLHLIDGELPGAKRPVIPGHEIVGDVIGVGHAARGFALGQRVGVPWLGGTCGNCSYCAASRENLCDAARFTGCHLDGGYAELALADARYCVALPVDANAVELAPLLCAGLIGHRALKLAGPAHRLGIYGFGAAAHIVAQVALAQRREVYAFTREGDLQAQAFALSLGARWAGASTQMPPQLLDAALLFAPAGELVPAALRATAKGGTVVCGGIHMSDIPSFPYALLWGERTLRSVANLTRADAAEFMPLALGLPVRTHCVPYPLEKANQALADLRAGRINGAAVLVPEPAIEC